MYDRFGPRISAFQQDKIDSIHYETRHDNIENISKDSVRNVVHVRTAIERRMLCPRNASVSH